MRDCLEYIGDIVAVHLSPVGALHFNMPFNVPVSSMKAEDIKYLDTPLSLSMVKAMDGFMVEGYNYNNVRAKSVIAERGITYKESSKLSAPGVSYDSKISIRSFEDIDIIRDLVTMVQSFEAFDAIIVDEADRAFLVRGVLPATNISMSASLPRSSQTQIDIQVISVSGVIPLLCEHVL